MKKLFAVIASFLAIFLLGWFSYVLNPSFTGNSVPARVFADGSVNWTGQGITDGSFNEEECDEENTPYIYWVFTLGGQNSVTAATLTLGGSGSGSYPMSAVGNNMKVTTPFFDLSTLTASASYTGTLGSGQSNLVISHGCPGEETTPTLTPTPTPTEVPCDPKEQECEPTPTPTETVTPTPSNPGNPGGPGDGRSDGLSSCPECTQAPKQGQVLGASTIAATGTFDSTLATIEQVAGVVLATVGTFVYGKKKTNKKSK